jgi:hypothetical protein
MSSIRAANQSPLKNKKRFNKLLKQKFNIEANSRNKFWGLPAREFLKFLPSPFSPYMRQSWKPPKNENFYILLKMY